MGLLDNIKQQIGSQFIEIIQWLDDTNDTMVYRFPVFNQEIKMNAQLTVRENQAALFINEGKAADLFGHFLWKGAESRIGPLAQKIIAELIVKC